MTINTPDWVKNAVFYQIFPDRFARSISSQLSFLKSISFEPWDAPPTFHGYKGGNLWGVIDYLDYLQDLGINAIYFTPIFHAPSNHRYNTRDYYQVDPMLGGNEAFRELLEKAHQRGIRIVLDGVFNHVGRSFALFNDVLENGEKSPWLDWFKIEGWPLSPYPGNDKIRQEYPANYACWEGHRSLPQLNHNNPAVREYIMQVAEYWIQQGIDGWRLDVPDCIQVPGFWQEFRDRVKSINPDAYIVGEIFGDASQWLDGTQFDGVMNYRFRKNTLVFAAGDRADLIPYEYLHTWDRQRVTFLSAEAYYRDKIQELLHSYPWEIQLTQLNLLSSHDTVRAMTVLGGERASVELATLLLFTFPGAPCIYYGDEVGLPGGKDPDCRRSFPSEDCWNRDILAYHRKLIALRHTYPALRTGLYQILLTQEYVYVLARILEQQELIVAVNTGDRETEVKIKQENKNEKEGYLYNLKTRPHQLLYGTGEAKWIDGQDISYLVLVLPPRSGLILGLTV
jgi:glycosidase